MFEFTSTSLPMIAYLDQYLDAPYWCHATDIVTMVAYAPAEGWPLWVGDDIEDGDVRTHVIRSLLHWKAFRNFNRQRVADPYGAFRQHLTEFITDVQATPGARPCLSDVEETEIEQFASAITERLFRFSIDVKGRRSCVLSSKTAHFFLPSLVPAYDRQVIRNFVLPSLARNCWDMRSYLLLSWWVLQQFRAEGTLEEARDAVARFMLARQLSWTATLPQPTSDHWLLRSMDSVVAEYTLIQMAENACGRYMLRRLAPA
jgi:hypothetical protein